jgi:hypothetical protein
MPGFEGIAAVGRSLERLLEFHLAQDPPPLGDATTHAALVRTEDLQALDNGDAEMFVHPPVLALFLYRVEVNGTMRAAWSGVGHQDGHAHLPLDLHYLLIPWAANALFECRILGRAMQALEDVPILSGPLLDPAAQWMPGEAVQVCYEQLSTEDTMRIFDSLPVDFKLCLSYVARVVRIEGRIDTGDVPATAVTVGLRAKVEEEPCILPRST